MLAQVFKNTSDRIGLCLDTAWAMHAHEDPIAMAEQFGDRLYGLHIKDFVFDRAGQHKDVVVGTGNLDLGKLNATLKAVDFDGVAVLEYEGDVSNPVPALSECVAAIRQHMKP
jgi:sugar phosphate isomerase/epimerase